MKNAHVVQAEQLHKLLYVVFPRRERQTRADARPSAAYVWGKRDLRSLAHG